MSDPLADLKTSMHTAVINDEANRLIPQLRIVFALLPEHDQSISLACAVLTIEAIRNAECIDCTRQEVFDNYIEMLHVLWRAAQSC